MAHQSDLLDQTKTFVSWVKAQLDITQPIHITLVSKKIHNGIQTSFGGFDPNNDKIRVVVTGRHMLDVFRTLAHEIVHFKQKLDGKDLDGSTGSDCENEANAVAGQLMREWNKRDSKS